MHCFCTENLRWAEYFWTGTLQRWSTCAALEIKSISFRDWAMALPLTAGGEAIMVPQYRLGIEGVSLELPGGLVYPEDASQEAAALGELREETGYEAAECVSMGSCFPRPAVLENRGFFFPAKNVCGVRGPQPDPEEIEAVLLPIDEIPAMIKQGVICNGMAQAAFHKYFMHYRKS